MLHGHVREKVGHVVAVVDGVLEVVERFLLLEQIAEVDGRPIGAMQLCDPYKEPTRYWGDIEPNLRALDIWIGEGDARGKGYGETMMRLAFARCLAPVDDD